MALAQTLQIGSPTLPRYRKALQRFDRGSQAYRFCEPKISFGSSTIQLVTFCFKSYQIDFIRKHCTTSSRLEFLLIKAANGENFDNVFQTVLTSAYQDDLDFDKLKRQLAPLVDVIHEAQPEMKKVTSIRTIMEAMKSHVTVPYCADYNRYFGKVLFYSSTCTHNRP